MLTRGRSKGNSRYAHSSTFTSLLRFPFLIVQVLVHSTALYSGRHPGFLRHVFLAQRLVTLFGKSDVGFRYAPVRLLCDGLQTLRCAFACSLCLALSIQGGVRSGGRTAARRGREGEDSASVQVVRRGAQGTWRKAVQPTQ